MNETELKELALDFIEQNLMMDKFCDFMAREGVSDDSIEAFFDDWCGLHNEEK